MGILQKTAFEVLAFQHYQLIRGHLPAIGAELNVQLAPGFEELVVGLCCLEPGDQLLFERCQALLELFQIPKERGASAARASSV